MVGAMEIREVRDKEQWERFFYGIEEKTFLQAWSWGEFQETMGQKIWRLGVCEKEDLVAVALVAKVRAKRGTYLMIQHGPVFDRRKIPNSQFPIFKAFLDKLKELGKEEGASFMRMASLWARNKENEQALRSLGFRASPMHANAYEATWKLDLTPSEDQLLLRMRKATRYLIRQTLRNKDIAVVQTKEKKDLEIFTRLQKETSSRQRFVPFSPSSIESEFDAFAKDNAASLFLGTYRGQVAAGALVIFWSGVAFYHQAASDAKHAKLSIPYAVQWEAIKEAKRRGCRMYDFWGYVDPKKHPAHPWAGPTLFKMGFGGGPVEYLGTQDYPLSWKYWPIALFEMLRKKRRSL